MAKKSVSLSVGRGEKLPTKQGAGMLIIMKNQNGQLFPYFKFFPRREMDNLGMHYSPADFERETGLAWQQTRMTGTGKDRREEVIARVDLKPKEAVPPVVPPITPNICIIFPINLYVTFLLLAVQVIDSDADNVGNQTNHLVS